MKRHYYPKNKDEFIHNSLVQYAEEGNLTPLNDWLLTKLWDIYSCDCEVGKSMMYLNIKPE